MASVAPVSSPDFRLPVQNGAQAAAGDDPFSLLLNAVTDVAAPREAEAPAAPRDDAPAPRPKAEADSERQSKERPADADTKAESKPAPESKSPAKAASDDDVSEDNEETGEADTNAVDALLAITFGETPIQTTVAAQVTAETPVIAQVTAHVASAVEAVAAPVQTAPVIEAATPEINLNADAEIVLGPQSNVKAQAGAAVDAKATASEAAVAAQAQVSAATETVSSLLKPVKNLTASTHIDVQTSVATVKGEAGINANTNTLPALVENLNAAVTKHLQLNASNEPAPPSADAPKPIISSNAVAPNFALTTHVSAPLDVRAQAAADATRAVPVESLAIEIVARAKDGQRRFEIRLDPPELGRIDVKLDVDSKGNATTKLVVERPETLDMLQRDARGLEKALQSAGLKMDSGGLEFSLSQQNGDGRPDARDPAVKLQVMPLEEHMMIQANLDNSRAARIRGGVDIRI